MNFMKNYKPSNFSNSSTLKILIPNSFALTVFELPDDKSEAVAELSEVAFIVARLGPEVWLHVPMLLTSPIKFEGTHELRYIPT